MALRLTVTSRHARSLGERHIKEFGHDGGTIGRSLQSDWALPDGQRYVSSRHASIDFRSGSYYIVDTSTNGVFVNGAEQPVGRGKPQRLFSGDRIKIGDYEIDVEIDDGEEIGHVTDERHIDPVDLAQRVEAPEPTGHDLVDAYEVTGVGIEELLTEDEAATLTPPSKLDEIELEIDDRPGPEPRITVATAAAPARPAAPAHPAATERAAVAQSRPAAKTPKAASATAPAAKPARGAGTPPAAPAKPRAARPRAQAAGKTASAPVPVETAGAGAAGVPAASAATANPPAAPSRSDPSGLVPVPGGKASSALEPFFRGAGLTPQRIDAQQSDAMLLCLGQLMREMIVGVAESLHLRAEQKNTLRLPNTTIQQRDNNPLKFSASVEETLTNLLFRQSQEYLSPVEAVREAYGDIRLHQQSLLRALCAALDAFTRRLDPDDLEQKFSRGKSGRLMGAANKLKYWDLFKDLYQIVAHHPPGELPAQFLDDFAHAYEDELARAPARDAERQAKVG